MNANPDFSPFVLCPAGRRAPAPRSLGSTEGVGDRLRTAAFAERQAVLAFSWAITTFTDAPRGLHEAWRRQIPEEQQHYDLIVNRMSELGFDLKARPVSRGMWDNLSRCATSREFCLMITTAEERGRLAGLRLAEFLQSRDPETAAIFQKISRDEEAHVALALTFFGDPPA